MNPEVHAIEIVAISNPVYSLIDFANVTVKKPTLESVIKQLIKNNLCKIGEKNGEKYKELLFDDFKVDLFIVDEKNFGLQYMIRTGSADYSRQFMIELNKIGNYQSIG